MSDDFNIYELERIKKLTENNGNDQNNDNDNIKNDDNTISNEKSKLLNNKLSELLNDHQYIDNNFIENLSINIDNNNEISANKDIERELSFYNQALLSLNKAIKLFHQHNILYKRPNDYYAEMLKPDQHMQKIKQSLLTEKRKIQIVENRKLIQYNNKYNKEKN